MRPTTPGLPNQVHFAVRLHSANARKHPPSTLVRRGVNRIRHFSATNLLRPALVLRALQGRRSYGHRPSIALVSNGLLNPLSCSFFMRPKHHGRAPHLLKIGWGAPAPVEGQHVRRPLSAKTLLFRDEEHGASS